MPTLIRLLVFLLVLAALAFGGMLALVATIDPGQKEMRVRIPTGDLLGNSNTAGNLSNNLPEPTLTTPEPEPDTPEPTTTTPPQDDQPE